MPRVIGTCKCQRVLSQELQLQDSNARTFKINNSWTFDFQDMVPREKPITSKQTLGRYVIVGYVWQLFWNTD